MKRARGEQMQALVLSYLKKRNFADSEGAFKLDFKFEETIQEMTTRATENSELSTPDSVSLTTFSIDDYFFLFADLLKFVAKLLISDQDIDGIRETVFPIFCHLYLNLVMADRKSDAVTFFKRFKSKVAPYASAYMSLDELGHVIQPQDVKSSAKVMRFRHRKLMVNMSVASHATFLGFLHKAVSLILLEVVNLHLHINIIEGKSLFDLFSQNLPPAEVEMPPVKDKVIKPHKVPVKPEKPVKEESKLEPVTLTAPSIMSPPTPAGFLAADPVQPLIPDVNMKMLSSAIQAITESKPSIGNICVHRIHDADAGGLTHAAFANGLHTISAGFEDSTCRLWKIARNSTHSKTSFGENLSKDTKPHSFFHSQSSDHEQPSPDVSRLNLACDFYENIKARLKARDASSALSGTCLYAHSGTVYSSCFTHDDRYLLTCSEDTTVRLWDPSSAKNKVVYRGHAYPVWCVCMSSFSLYFATGSYDKTARLWSTERTYPLRTFAGHHGDVEGVCFHKNASYLATADKTIRLWDLSSGKTVRLMLGHWAAASTLAFSPNGKNLASSGEDGRIRLWDIASGGLIKEMRGHEGAVYSMDFSPDGSMLVSGGMDSCLRVWNARTASSRANTDTNDPNLNPDLVGRWNVSTGSIHAVKFESSNLLHCAVADS